MNSEQIAIIDYGCGNLKSIENMLRKIGANSIITNQAEAIDSCSKIILPGVGHWDHGMQNIKNLGLLGILENAALAKNKPILGICLGAQILTTRSDEGNLSGLGFLQAETIAFDKTRLDKTHKVPHIGWAETELDETLEIFGTFSEPPRFYYTHSYHFKANGCSIISETTHGYKFPSGLNNNNIYALQFHPEKSHKFGMQILRNFSALPA